MDCTEARFSPANHGVNFDPTAGKIFFFSPASITVAKCWPKPMAWRKTQNGWQHLRLTDDFFFLPREDLANRVRQIENGIDQYGQFHFPFMRSSWEKAELARLNWYLTIPRDIRDQVSLFSTRQWHLLSLLARCGDGAFDLARSSPALSFALASNWVFHKPAVKRPLRSARALLRTGKNQQDILSWLGFPPTNSARRILAKIVPQTVSISSLLYLRQAMHQSDLMQRLTHVSRLNAGVLRILTDRQMAALADYQLVEEVSQASTEDRTPHSAYILRDTAYMFSSLFPDRHFPKVKSVDQLNRLHADLVLDLNTLPPENLVFPQPPVEGNDKIIPILNSHDLTREGREMNHCVSSYSRRIALRKDVFVYKVIAPERCTLSIQKSRTRWRISELKRSCNRQVSRSTISMVKCWLNPHSIESADRAKNRSVHLSSGPGAG